MMECESWKSSKLIGMAVIGLCGYGLTLNESSNFRLGVGITLGLGCLIFITSFCGCCGAISEHRCLTVTYAVVMVLLLTVQIIVIVAAVVYKNKALDIENKSIESKFESRSSDWYEMQRKYKCCGNRGLSDYKDLPFLPISCCENTEYNCTPDTAYQIGCKRAILGRTAKLFNIIIYASAGIILIEAIASALGFILYRTFKKQKEIY